MKTVLFFSRNDLVNLYGGVNQHLSDSVNVIHLAYSSVEEKILKEKYNIQEVINFREEIDVLIKNERPDLNLINRIDALIIAETTNRFCLNSCIQSDRTFANMEYAEILILVQVYYTFWDKLLAEKQIDYLLHEPVALFFLQIASVICQKNGANYLTQIQVFGENKYNWIFVDAHNALPVELPGILWDPKTADKIDLNRVENFLSGFRKDYELIIPQLATKRSTGSQTGILPFLIQLLKTVIKHFLKKNNTKKENSAGIENHLENYLSNNRPQLADKLKNQWDEHFYLNYDRVDEDKVFYYYPMHMEPEASVLYWGDGIYKNQIKLIENIASQLPPDCFLYVKVHPIVKEQRHFIDYKRLKSIPNLKLLGPDVPGRIIISACRGVFTINGTSGFEAVLLNKPVYVFGNSFYDLSNRVFKIKNIRDLREILYHNHSQVFSDDEQLRIFVDAFLKISHPGYTAYYSNYTKLLKIEHEKNVEEVAKGFKEFFIN